MDVFIAVADMLKETVVALACVVSETDPTFLTLFAI